MNLDDEMRLVRKLGKPEIGLGLGLGDGAGEPFYRLSILKDAYAIGRAKLLFYGDSETMGRASGSGPNSTDGSKELSYPAKVKDGLNALGVTADDQTIIADGNTDDITDYAAYNPAVAVGTWEKGVGIGLGGCIFRKRSTAGSGSFVYAPPNPIDTWEIYYLKNTTFGVLVYSVDGGITLPTIDQLSVMPQFVKQTIAAPSLAVNTFRATRSAVNSNTVFLAALSGYNSATKFIDVMNAGGRGYAMSVEGALTDVPWRPQLALPIFAPHCTGFNIGVNDFRKNGPGDSAGLTVANWKATYQLNIDAAKTTGEVFLMVPFQYASTLEGNVTQAEMRSAIYELADVNKVGVFDIPNRIGTYAQLNALGQMAPDGIHPSGVTPFANLGAALAAWIAARL